MGCVSAFAQGKLTEAQTNKMWEELRGLGPGGKGSLAGEVTFTASKDHTFLGQALRDR